MHTFTGNNIETNLEVARIQLKKECGETVEKVGETLVCPNGYVIEDTLSENSLVSSIKNIVRGHSSVFVDLGDGTAKKISTTIVDSNNMYKYGYIAEASMYDKVIVDEESFVKFTKVKGVPKTKACDPLKNSKDDVVGALCVGIPEKPTISQIQDKVKEYGFGDAGIVYLIDTYETRVGNVVAHPLIETNTNVLDVEYVANMLDKSEGIVQYEIDGVKKIAAFVSYEPYDMLVVAESNLIEEQSLQSMRIIVLSLIVLILSVVGGLFFARSISNPIIRLKDAADKVTSGEDVSLPAVKGSDEIAELTGSMAMLIQAFKFAKSNNAKRGRK
jgi:HAMP domain-containing protein